MSLSKIALYVLLIFSVAIILNTNLITPVLAQQVLHLEPIDDAFVLIDKNDPEDVHGYQHTNTGDLDFLKLWYAWDVTENHEKISSVIYLKFNLSDVKSENVKNAELKMKPYLARLTNVERGIDIVIVPNNDWQESEITYANRPQFPNIVTATTNISSENEWSSWNITEQVRKAAGSEITFAVGFKQIFQNTEELLTFYSKESNNADIPYLQVDIAEQQTQQPVTAEDTTEQQTQPTSSNFAQQLCEMSGGKYNSQKLECETTSVPSKDTAEPKAQQPVPSKDTTEPRTFEPVPSKDTTEPQTQQSIPSEDLTPVIVGVIVIIIGAVVTFVMFRKKASKI